MEYTFLIKDNQIMTTCNWLDLETLGFPPILFQISLDTTLNNPITMCHNNFLQRTLICVLRINMDHIIFQPMLNSNLKINVGDLV